MSELQDSVSAETRKGPSPGSASTRLSPSAAIVRRHDRDRYQTALFAPADRREALFALYAFNHEIARVREIVTQPMLGQIRLQWWREVIDAAYAGTPPRRHQVAEPLVAAIAERGLSRAYFDRIIDTRERDLADTPPPDVGALQDYAEGTSSSLVCLALEALNAADSAALAAAREIGIGYALAGLLRAMPFHAAAGRSYIPGDIAARVALDREDYGRRRDTPALRAASVELAETAAAHLTAARRRSSRIPRRANAALLPAVIADRFLLRLKRTGYNPFAPELAAPHTLQSWRLLAAALRNCF